APLIDAEILFRQPQPPNLDEINANGTLRFTQANLKQGLFISDSTFDVTKDCKLWTKNEKDTAVIDLEGPACGIYAPDADVGATFRWRQITKISNSTPKQTLFWLFLSGSSSCGMATPRSGRCLSCLHGRSLPLCFSKMHMIRIRSCQAGTIKSARAPQIRIHVRALLSMLSYMRLTRWCPLSI